MVDPLGNEEVIVSVFPSIWHSSAINDVIQARLDLVVDIIKGFALLGASSNDMNKRLAEGTLLAIVSEVGVDWCRLGNIPFLCLVLESGGNGCSSVVAWSGLWCW